MKTNDFERILIQVGFSLLRSSAHKVWTNGAQTVIVPHARNINRMLARRILKQIKYSGKVGELNYG